MAGLVRLRGVQPMFSRLIQQRRSVGTSNAKKSDTITASPSTSSTADAAAECQPPKRNWVSYGYSEESEEIDRRLNHMSWFLSISVLFTLGGYVLCYLPDFRMRDWYQREAYLELRRREQLGLPHIDINLVDPAKVKLPPDEELSDDDIII